MTRWCVVLSTVVALLICPSVCWTANLAAWKSCRDSSPRQQSRCVCCGEPDQSDTCDPAPADPPGREGTCCICKAGQIATKFENEAAPGPVANPSVNADSSPKTLSASDLSVSLSYPIPGVASSGRAIRILLASFLT